LIRELFAETQEAKMRGYGGGRFSFNVKGGRCEACCGDGIIKIEMHFLPDVYVPCEVCAGKRYNRETLEVKYKGNNIHEVLEMTVEEALEFFHNIPKINRKLQTLYDVGLDYIKLGQPATTLSGGEAQRVKLATELTKRSTGSASSTSFATITPSKRPGNRSPPAIRSAASWSRSPVPRLRPAASPSRSSMRSTHRCSATC
jgi:excinuclease ABC subunit A